jgi:hypothetical protein
MTEQEVNFEILNLPIPTTVKTYSKEKQQAEAIFFAYS